jgi:flagellar assembly protein FliH
MGVIKAARVTAEARRFSLPDFEVRARELIEHAQVEAQRLITAARVEAEHLRLSARHEAFETGHRMGLEHGLMEGREAGRCEASAEAAGELKQAFAALVAAAAEVDAARQELAAAALDDVVRLALAIARRIVRKEGLSDAGVLRANLAGALNLIMSWSDVRVAIHPAQRRTLDELLPSLMQTWPAIAHVKIVEDASVAPGGCRVYTKHGEVDADLDAQLDRIAAELTCTAHGDER